jgi:hypothetical protein
MLRRMVTAAPMRLGWHQVLMVECTLSKTLLMKSRVGSTASASAAPSLPPLQHPTYLSVVTFSTARYIFGSWFVLPTAGAATSSCTGAPEVGSLHKQTGRQTMHGRTLKKCGRVICMPVWQQW